jgi:hypothetical protein
MDRRASIVELKHSYWEQAWKNLQSAEMTGTQNMLLEDIG